MLIEGVLEVYDSIVEWNEQIYFSRNVQIIFFFPIKKHNFRRVSTISESAVQRKAPDLQDFDLDPRHGVSSVEVDDRRTVMQERQFLPCSHGATSWTQILYTVLPNTPLTVGPPSISEATRS
jgi:hypothetical protein